MRSEPSSGACAVSAPRVVRELRRTRLDVAEVHYPAGFAMPEHEHAGPYLTFTLRGGYEERIERGWRCREAGVVLFRPAGERHASRFGDRGAVCLRVRVSEAWVRLACGTDAPARSLELASPRAGRLAAHLFDEVRLGRRACELAMESLVTALLAESGRASAGVRAPHWTDEVGARLAAAFPRRPSLAELALDLGVRPARLTREFRRAQGRSIGERYRELQIACARERLLQSTPSLAEVALEAGFADQSHLAREFRRATGSTPSAYRQAAARSRSGSF